MPGQTTLNQFRRLSRRAPMAFETPSTPESAASGNYARSCGIVLHRGHYKLNILEVCLCLHGARLQQFSIWVSMVCIHTELRSAVGNYKFSRVTKSVKWFPQGNTVRLHLAGANTHLKTGILFRTLLLKSPWFSCGDFNSFYTGQTLWSCLYQRG